MYFAFNEENGEFVYFEFYKYTKFVLQTPHIMKNDTKCLLILKLHFKTHLSPNKLAPLRRPANIRMFNQMFRMLKSATFHLSTFDCFL